MHTLCDVVISHELLCVIYFVCLFRFLFIVHRRRRLVLLLLILLRSFPFDSALIPIESKDDDGCFQQKRTQRVAEVTVANLDTKQNHRQLMVQQQCKNKIMKAKRTGNNKWQIERN